MSDLVLNTEGDIKVTQKSNAAVFDNRVIDGEFDIETTNNFIKDLVVKAIKTPKGKITLFVLDTEDILIKDSNYGSDIYRELSEGITLNFLSRVKSHITQSLINANLNNNIKDIQIGVVNSNTIQLIINYADYNISENINLQL
jgi:hypothetical protein